MSIELANSSGTIDQVASNGGFADLLVAIKSTSSAAKEHVALEAFIDRGFTDAVDNCVLALREMEKDPDLKEDVKTTVEGLASMMDGETFVILTDGTSDDSD